MARASIDKPTKDLLSDTGAVLVSIVRGEQFEYPVEIATSDYASDCDYEAVIVEAVAFPKSLCVPS